MPGTKAREMMRDKSDHAINVAQQSKDEPGPQSIHCPFIPAPTCRGPRSRF